MECKITKNAPLIKGKGGRQPGQKKLEVFSELDKLGLMDKLTIIDEKPSMLRSLIWQYQKVHPEKKFRSRLNGDEIDIQRMEDKN
ncbi:MAG: hypothetical protein KA285_06730 [Bacteroidia bacterium]|nr:hypothetical protein [Bacteroidia bacterium]